MATFARGPCGPARVFMLFDDTPIVPYASATLEHVVTFHG